ncbi:MAG: FAD binding domain-containing protein [Caldiserica bacterium]|jgi:carbon-monoxide dehydrogenase medium subunit/2-furoyl-CoA dehydrogenase FAD binding subunit|nr:FAD binding domain-containing protein [Caldisericota bacterium]MDH7562671.1 FAD binding domain-containing protein [Caldisericota bacterium]
MLKEIVEYFTPRELVEAQEFLIKHFPEAAVVGGGLDLTWRERKGIKYLISLDKLPLKFIRRRDGFLEIGATTTIRELIEFFLPGDEFPDFLKPALKRVATPLLRGVITIGGALARAYPWGDLPPIFMGLESQIELFDGEARVLPLQEFYTGDFREALRKAILTKIILPLNPQKFTSYRRFTRTEVDIPLFNQIVSLEIMEGKVKWARVLMGARPGFPYEEFELEEFLLGKMLDEDLIIRASDLLKKIARVESDFRLSREYRRHLSGVFLEENLREIKGKYDSQFHA